MSLAPSEQRALRRIEEDLRCSDPRLDTMLATFIPPRTVRLAWRFGQVAAWRPGRCAVAVIVGVAVIGLIILAWALAVLPAGPDCPARLQAIGCPPAGRAVPAAPSLPGAQMAPAVPPPAAPAAPGHRSSAGGSS